MKLTSRSKRQNSSINHRNSANSCYHCRLWDFSKDSERNMLWILTSRFQKRAIVLFCFVLRKLAVFYLAVIYLNPSFKLPEISLAHNWFFLFKLCLNLDRSIFINSLCFTRKIFFFQHFILQLKITLSHIPKPLQLWWFKNYLIMHLIWLINYDVVIFFILVGVNLIFIWYTFQTMAYF